MQRPAMRRRTVMKVLGTGATASLAGCTGDDGSGSTGEPDTPGGGEGTTAAEEGATEGTASDSAEDEIIATQPIWPTTLDPMTHGSSNTQDMVNDTAFDPLFYYNETITEEGNYVLEQVPALATDYEFLNDENTEIRFFLREDVTFHNGDEFTPEDVVFSFKRELDPEASDIGAPGATALPTYDDIVVVDDEFAVDLTLTNSSPKTMDRVSGGPVIMNKEFVESNDQSTVAQEPVGTGPYQFESYEEGSELVYTAYEDYWGEQPDFGTLRWRVANETNTQVSQLLTGETDLAVEINPQGLSRINDADSGKTATTPTPRAVFMQMRNTGDDDPPFRNKQFRQAMCLAVDNQNIAENVVGEYGQIMSQLAPDFLPEANPDLEPYPHDPEQAEQLVEESGLAGTEFTLHTPQGRYLRDAEAAQAIVSDIDSLPNVSASVNIRDPNSWISDLTSDTASEQPAASIVGWGGADYLVKTAIVQCSLVEGSWGGNCYDTLEEAIEAANGISEWDPYVEACREINRILHDEYVNIWLYNTSNLYGLSDRLDWEPMISEDVYPAQFDQAE